MSERLRLWLERDRRGAGYHLRDAATGERVTWEDERISVVPVAGVSFRPEAVADATFDPGARLVLVPEPENEHDPNAIGDLERRPDAAGRLRAARDGVGARRATSSRSSLWRAGRGAARADRAAGLLGRAPPQVASTAVPYAFKLPDLGEGLTEGEVARWLVAEGDEIAEDQPLVEIQTDKTTVEIPSPAGGTVQRDLRRRGRRRPRRHGARRDRRRQCRVRPPNEQVTVCYERPVRRPSRGGRRPAVAFRRRRSCAGSRRSWAWSSQQSRRPARGDVSPRTTSVQPPAERIVTKEEQVTVCYKRLGSRARGGERRCAACGGRSSSTWRARTARCPPSRSSRNATSRASI